MSQPFWGAIKFQTFLIKIIIFPYISIFVTNFFQMFRITLGLTLFLTFAACHSIQEKQKPVKERELGNTPIVYPKFQLGTVIRKVNIEKVPTHSYALYLPENYSPDKKWPLIYFFDPHASGWLPLEKYSQWANQFGFILVGSNQSKNGLNSSELNQIIGEWFTDTFEKLSIDKRRVYTMGFSGGARVAASLAIANPLIRGVVACGGGLPLSKPLENFRTDYLCFVGEEDFNRFDLVDLDRELVKIPVRHHLILFNGKHEWPDSLTFKDAFYWTVFNEMKDKLIPVDQHVIQDFLEINRTSLKASKKNEDPLATYQITTKIIDFLKGLAPTSDFESQLTELIKQPSFLSSMKELDQIHKEENQLKRFYLQSFNTRNTDWWDHEMKVLNHKISTQTGERKKEALRVLHFLSLVAFMQVNSNLQSGQFAIAQRFINLYRIIDPENPDVYYFSAVLNAQTGHPKIALEELKISMSYGFSDKQRLLGEKSFDSIRSDSVFLNMLKQINQ